MSRTDRFTFPVLLDRISSGCRTYVLQGENARKLTFADMQEAADSVATLADDSYGHGRARQVRKHAMEIVAHVDNLAQRFGSEEPGGCRVCGQPLVEVVLDKRSGDTMRYCNDCPSAILNEIREIEDLVA